MHDMLNSLGFTEVTYGLISHFMQLYFNPATVKMLSNLKVISHSLCCMINFSFFATQIMACLGIAYDIACDSWWILLKFWAIILPKFSSHFISRNSLTSFSPLIFILLCCFLTMVPWDNWKYSSLDSLLKLNLLLMVGCWLCMLQVLVIALLLKVVMKRRFSIIQVSA